MVCTLNHYQSLWLLSAVKDVCSLEKCKFSIRYYFTDEAIRWTKNSRQRNENYEYYLRLPAEQMALQQELIQKAQSKEAYDEIADEIFRLRELRQKTTVDTAARDEQIKRINDLQDYIAQQTAHLTEFNESLVRRWVKQITIWDDHITVELKSGVSIDVDA